VRPALPASLPGPGFKPGDRRRLAIGAPPAAAGAQRGRAGGALAAFDWLPPEADRDQPGVRDGNPEARIMLIGEARGPTRTGWGAIRRGSAASCWTACSPASGLTAGRHTYKRHLLAAAWNRRRLPPEIAACLPFVERTSNWSRRVLVLLGAARPTCGRTTQHSACAAAGFPFEAAHVPSPCAMPFTIRVFIKQPHKTGRPGGLAGDSGAPQMSQ